MTSSFRRRSNESIDCPAFATAKVSPVGEQLVTAFDDLGRVFGSGEGSGDVVVEAIPIPATVAKARGFGKTRPMQMEGADVPLELRGLGPLRLAALKAISWAVRAYYRARLGDRVRFGRGQLTAAAIANPAASIRAQGGRRAARIAGWPRCRVFDSPCWRSAA